MAERDLTQLYDLIGKLRDKYDVIIEIWSVEDLEATLSSRDPELTAGEVAQRAASIWPTVRNQFGEATVPYGHEVISGIIDDVEGK